MTNQMQFLAVIPQGLDEEGCHELSQLGAQKVISNNRTISFEADFEGLYKIHLYARLPFRVFRQLARFQCDSPQSLYQKVKTACDWKLWLPPSRTFKVEASGMTGGLNHSHFSALQVKNALVDLQQEEWGRRSDINLIDPDLCFHLYMSRGNAVLSLATSTKSLHRRGYRSAMGLAPIKENLASGLILKTKWNGQVPLVDPLCGSGTFLIEAASMSLGRAPGLNHSFLFEKWIDFDRPLWSHEKEIAIKSQLTQNKLPQIIGCEENIDIANQAEKNIISAGLESSIKIKNIDFTDLQLPEEKGILLCNPPYGKRIGEEKNLSNLYLKLGKFCKKNASGWNLWLLSGNPKLTQFLKMKSKKRIPITNGGIDCRWLNYEIN